MRREGHLGLGEMEEMVGEEVAQEAEILGIHHRRILENGLILEVVSSRRAGGLGSGAELLLEQLPDILLETEADTKLHPVKALGLVATVA